MPKMSKTMAQKWAEKWNVHHAQMIYLTEFEKKIQAYDGMIIETGGRFAQGKLGGDKYEEKCLDDAKNFISAGGSKKSLIEIVDHSISFYEKETEWLFQNLEMAFLTSIKQKLMDL